MTRISSRLLLALAAATTSASPIDDGTVTITSQVSYAFPFVAERSGYLQRVSANLGIARALIPDVPVMVEVNDDRGGRIVLQPVIDVTTTIDERAHPDSPTVFEVPMGIELEAGKQYWVMVESPTGNEIAWATTADKVGRRFRKNVITGELGYDDNQPQARFSVHIANPP